jgi:hypothetical protein
MRRRTQPPIQPTHSLPEEDPPPSQVQRDVWMSMLIDSKRSFFVWCWTIGNIVFLTYNIFGNHPVAGQFEQGVVGNNNNINPLDSRPHQAIEKISLESWNENQQSSKLRLLRQSLIRPVAANTNPLYTESGAQYNHQEQVGREEEGDSSCNLSGVSVLVLDVHFEGNLGDEMETTPFLQELHNCHVNVTVALSEWMPQVEDRIHSRTSREHMLVQHITTRPYSTLNPKDYHAVLVAPGPWKLCLLHRQWMSGISPSAESDRWYDPTNHISNLHLNSLVKDDDKKPVRTIDVFFAGSFLPEDKAYCQNPDALLEQYYLPQMLHLVVLRESISYRYVMDRQKAATPPTTLSFLGTEPEKAPRKQILLSGDLSYSFQPSVAAMEYWTEYFVTRGYYGHRFFAAAAAATSTTSTTTTSSKRLASPTKPLILLFSRVNNFARGVRILRNDNESTQERQRPNGGDQDPRRIRNRRRHRRGDDHDETELHDPGGDGEPPSNRHQGETDEQSQQQQQQQHSEIEQQPPTSSKLMIKVANGTKVLLNTSHVVFTSSSDIEDASHFQFLRDQYPYLFPKPRRPTGGQAPSLDELRRNRDPLVLCQSVEQLFALVSLADHVYTDRYHPGVVAHRFGIPFTVLSYPQEQVKLNGLKELTLQHSPLELHQWNRDALNGLRDFLRRRLEERGTTVH